MIQPHVRAIPREDGYAAYRHLGTADLERVESWGSSNRDPYVQRIANEYLKGGAGTGHIKIPQRQNLCTWPLDLIDDRTASLENSIYLSECLKLLDPLAREIQLLYDEGLTQDEIAVRLGCSQAHVSRILAKKLDALE